VTVSGLVSAWCFRLAVAAVADKTRPQATRTGSDTPSPTPPLPKLNPKPTPAPHPAGLGVRLVIVLGAAPQIDTAVEERGLEPEFHGSYRITRAAVLEAAVEAAGRTRTAVEQYLSRAPSVPVFRRHAKDDGEMHFGPALNVVRGLGLVWTGARARLGRPRPALAGWRGRWLGDVTTFVVLTPPSPPPPPPPCAHDELSAADCFLLRPLIPSSSPHPTQHRPTPLHRNDDRSAATTWPQSAAGWWTASTLATRARCGLWCGTPSGGSWTTTISCCCQTWVSDGGGRRRGLGGWGRVGAGGRE